MDPRRVLTFRVVAHERSFSRAARQRALSQPSMTNQVAQLEREIGARLLVRRPGGLALTSEGEILLGHADAIASRFELARTQIATASEGRRAQLRIGALPSALAGFVPAAIDHLHQTAPDIRVTFDEGPPAELSARVNSGKLDLAIVYEDAGTVPKAPRVHHLFRERFMVALAPNHPLATRRTVRLADLRDEDWTAALSDGVIVRTCRAAGFEPRLVSITRDQLAIRALVITGLPSRSYRSCWPTRSATSHYGRSPTQRSRETSSPCYSPAPCTRSCPTPSPRSTRPRPTSHASGPATPGARQAHATTRQGQQTPEPAPDQHDRPT